MKATCFEDLIVWQKARDLAVAIYQLTKQQPFVKDHGFKDQIQRAAVSVSSNIAEGFERNSNKEFINFLFIAKGSCGEVRSQLRIAVSIGYVKEADISDLLAASIETSKLLTSFIRSLRRSDITGVRYKP